MIKIFLESVDLVFFGFNGFTDEMQACIQMQVPVLQEMAEHSTLLGVQTQRSQANETLRTVFLRRLFTEKSLFTNGKVSLRMVLRRVWNVESRGLEQRTTRKCQAKLWISSCNYRSSAVCFFAEANLKLSTSFRSFYFWRFFASWEAFS